MKKVIQVADKVLVFRGRAIGLKEKNSFWLKCPWNKRVDRESLSVLKPAVLKHIINIEGKEYSEFYILPKDGRIEWYDEYLKEITQQSRRIQTTKQREKHNYRVEWIKKCKQKYQNEVSPQDSFAIQGAGAKL